jgi:hypothetical protein
MHGGKSPGAPKGNKNAFRHGRYSAAAIARRREIGALLRVMNALVRSFRGEELNAHQRTCAATTEAGVLLLAILAGVRATKKVPARRSPNHGARRVGVTFLYAFDLLKLDGQDLRAHPWDDRRVALAGCFAAARRPAAVRTHLEGSDGATVFKHACAMGLEGRAKARTARCVKTSVPRH